MWAVCAGQLAWFIVAVFIAVAVLVVSLHPLSPGLVSLVQFMLTDKKISPGWLEQEMADSGHVGVTPKLVSRPPPSPPTLHLPSPSIADPASFKLMI